MDEVLERIQEAIALCLEDLNEEAPMTEFLGFQRLTVEV